MPARHYTQTERQTPARDINPTVLQQQQQFIHSALTIHLLWDTIQISVVQST